MISEAKLEEARNLVIADKKTIKEAAEITGVNESTLKNYSSKEQWQESQKEYNKFIKKELLKLYGVKQLENIFKALEDMEQIKAKTMELLQDAGTNIRDLKNASDILVKTTAAQCEMVGIQTDTQDKNIEEVPNIEIIFEAEETEEI